MIGEFLAEFVLGKHRRRRRRGRRNILISTRRIGTRSREFGTGIGL